MNFAKVKVNKKWRGSMAPTFFFYFFILYEISRFLFLIFRDATHRHDLGFSFFFSFFFLFCKKRNKLKTIRWRLPVNITVSFDRGLNLVSITLERARFLARGKNLIRRKEIFNQDIPFFPLFLNYSYYSSGLLMIIT